MGYFWKWCSFCFLEVQKIRLKGKIIFLWFHIFWEILWLIFCCEVVLVTIWSYWFFYIIYCCKNTMSFSFGFYFLRLLRFSYLCNFYRWRKCLLFIKIWAHLFTSFGTHQYIFFLFCIRVHLNSFMWILGINIFFVVSCYGIYNLIQMLFRIFCIRVLFFGEADGWMRKEDLLVELLVLHWALEFWRGVIGLYLPVII